MPIRQLIVLRAALYAIAFAIVGIAAFASSACFGGSLLEAQKSAQSPIQVRLVLQWMPQSQFAGFYLAQQQGYYTAIGAEVSLLHANAHRASLDHLQAGEAELATAFLADAMVAASVAAETTTTQYPVLIGQLVQHSNLMLLAWKDRGIQRLEDLNSQRISLWPGPFSAALHALLADHQIAIDYIPQYGTINLFLHGGVTACAAMEYNEYHRIWQAGIDTDDLIVFRAREFGFNFPEDGLYARADWQRRYPDLARRLWQATLAGWEYARTHPEQAIDLVMAEADRAGVLTNRPHERWMLTHLLASIFPDDTSPISTASRLKPATYTSIAQTLIASKLLTQALPFAQFCPTCCPPEDQAAACSQPDAF